MVRVAIVLCCHDIVCVADVLQALTGDCGFLAANLYARSIFGEDALANLSIEKVMGAGDKVSVQGHVRIRAKTQVRSQLRSHDLVLW